MEKFKRMKVSVVCFVNCCVMHSVGLNKTGVLSCRTFDLSALNAFSIATTTTITRTSIRTPPGHHHHQRVRRDRSCGRMHSYLADPDSVPLPADGMAAVFERRPSDRAPLDDTDPLTCNIEGHQQREDHTVSVRRRVAKQ